MFDNDLFVVGNRLLHQKKGVAIGGIILVQLAELFCMGKELKFMTQTVEAQKQQQAKLLPPHSLNSIPISLGITLWVSLGVRWDKLGYNGGSSTFIK